MTEPPYKGIIFDFNGVLLWDNHLHEEAWRRYSTGLRGAPLTGEEMARHVHGRVNLDIFAYLLGRSVGDDEVRPLAEEKERIYRHLALETIDTYRLSPGASELLDFLVANDVPRAIATSSPSVNIGFFIEHLDLLSWFDEERIIYDRGLYPGKPAPDIYLEAIERLGLPPDQCIVVEDSLAGIRSAYDASIGAIVAMGATESHAALAGLAGVRKVIVDFREFPRRMLTP